MAMKKDQDLVRQLLVVLDKKLQESDDPFSAKDFAKALYGCRLLSSADKIVIDIIRPMLPKIESNADKFDNWTFATAFHGLGTMSADNQPVQDLIQFLTRKLRESNEELTGHTIAEIL